VTLRRLRKYNSPKALEELAKGVRAGDRRSLARALRVADELPQARSQLMPLLHEHAGGALRVGITGNPGAGKSTLVDVLLSHLRKSGKKVAVLAVDPTSPYTGGAILGDRIRMNRHFSDDGVYIRSSATRGLLGGLSRSSFDSVRILDAAGFDVILIETVGVGQDEVDVIRLVDTTLVVTVPGLGDDIQAIKAGLLEVADVFVLNKSDRDGANDLERGLRYMLSLLPSSEAWEPPIVKTIATRSEGVIELWAKVEQHRAFLSGTAGESKRAQRRREFFNRLVDTTLLEKNRARLGPHLDEAMRRVVDENKDPYQVVADLLAEHF
jgi:LAO/AO transport system kinase